jgi:His/Glu/Gln/Arg/opine family amino acid ABC transporter permease subunit
MRTFDIMAGAALTIGAIAAIVTFFGGREGFSLAYLSGEIPEFLGATRLTLYVTSVSYVIGMCIGFVIGWARTARIVPLRKLRRDRALLLDSGTPRWAQLLGAVPWILWIGLKYVTRRIADGYVEIMRGTPLFVQIIFMWSVLLVNYPRIGQLELIAGTIALTLNTGAYQGEIFRAGLQTVHSGQLEAARAIGLSRGGAMRHIVLPQALRLIVPPLTNEYIGLLKSSSLLVVIGVAELTSTAREEAFISFRVFEVFALVSAIYLLITVPVSKVVEAFARKYRIPGLGIQTGESARV